jgi:hypothetical protein
MSSSAQTQVSWVRIPIPVMGVCNSSAFVLTCVGSDFANGLIPHARCLLSRIIATTEGTVARMCWYGNVVA